MITSAQVREIEARLAGNGEMGGGDAPQPFFLPILDKIYDEGSITLAEAEDTALVTSERKRIERLWKDHGGFLGFIRGLLDIIEYRELAIKDNDADIWRRGPTMVAGEKVLLLSPLKGVKNSSVSYTVRSAEERQRLDDDSREQGNISALAASLMPSALGLRRVSPERLARINKSIDDNGFRDTSPIIIDGQDRIISGRHRIEIERTRYNGEEKWHRQREKGLSAYDAVQMAMASNEGSPWDRKDYERLDRLGLQGTKTQRLRQKIELALLEDSTRTNHAIGKLLDCCETTVGTVRRGLIEIGHSIENQGVSNKYPNSGAARAAIESALLQNVRRSNREIGELAGCHPQTVDKIRVLLEDSGQIEPYICPSGPRGANGEPKQSARKRRGIPDNIKQALIDNPTLNHAALARKIGERPIRVANYCSRLIAGGVYSVCEHHRMESGALVRQTKQGGRKPVPAPVEQIHASPDLLLNGSAKPMDLQAALARIAELETELAAAYARIADLEDLAGIENRFDLMAEATDLEDAAE